MALQPWHYVVLIGTLALVWGFAIPKGNKDSPKRVQAIDNMETALDQFMENMEAENRRLAEAVLRAQRELGSRDRQREERIAELERRCAALEAALEHRSRPGVAGAPSVAIAGPAGMRSAGSGDERDAPSLEASGDEEHASFPEGSGRDEPGPISEEPQREAENRQDQTIRSRYKNLFELLEQGRSVDQAARELDMNKGEAELIRQLAKQEERAYG